MAKNNNTRYNRSGKPQTGTGKNGGPADENTSNNRGRGGRNNKPRDDRSRRDSFAGSDDCGTRRDHNDISWLYPNERMLVDTASIPFGYRVGDPMHLLSSLYNRPAYRTPGIMDLRYLPTYGPMEGHGSAINNAATAIYSWIRHVNSGSKNYDAPDLMMYLMAMDSIYTGIGYCAKILAAAMKYSWSTRYTPEHIILASGTVPNNELFGNLCGFRDRLNRVILKATTLAVPTTFPLYARHMYMTSNVHKDEDSDKAQFYTCTPSYLYRLVTSPSKPRYLEPVEWAGASGVSHIFSTYLDKLEDMVSRVYGDEDAGIMAGDIMKAYGDKLYKIGYVEPDTVLEFTYDKEFLHQIHNATIAGEACVAADVDSNYPGCSIYQVVEDSSVSGPASFLVQHPIFGKKYGTIEQIPEFYANGTKALDIHGDVDPKMILRATRFMPGAASAFHTSDNAYIYSFTNPGTEVITSVTIFKLSDSGLVSEQVPAALMNWDTYGETIADLNTFSFGPLVYEGAGNSNPVTVLGNTDNLTTVTDENLAALNRMVALGVFNVDRLTLAK